MKAEAAALSVRAQRYQSHYFSTTPRMLDVENIVTEGTVKAFAKTKSLFLLFGGEVRVVWE